MKYQKPCIECAKRQGIRVYNLALESIGAIETNGKVHELQQELNREIDTADPLLSPAALSQIAIRSATRYAAVDDPFREIKKKTNALALSLYSRMKERIAQNENPLYFACQLAACGNIIDLGIQEDFDIHATIAKVTAEGFQRNDFEEFLHILQQAEKKSVNIRLLYLCDNAGEIVFDRLFIEELLSRFPHLHITAAVNHGPVLNDATMADAVEIELDKITPVIHNNNGELGTALSAASPEFLAFYHATDVIVSKGQANYETLSHRDENIFFILKAKCEVIANSLGVKLYDAVMTRSPYRLAKTN
ncbi:MAG: DUF89 family protein [Candidatus Omnitrophota bacterium]|jgi:uncharacterized protein with ATP-grasp and redox domains|nr:MAG: DUF89 family protein [Candidatus Omnitrophota bacterium]